MTNQPENEMATRTYADQYRILRETAEKLRKGGPEDIDALFEDVQGAIDAFEFCRDRIAAIQSKIDVELGRVRDAETSASTLEAPLF